MSREKNSFFPRSPSVDRNDTRVCCFRRTREKVYFVVPTLQCVINLFSALSTGVRCLRDRTTASHEPEAAHQPDHVGPRGGTAVPAAAQHVRGGQGQDWPHLPEHGVRQLLPGVGDRRPGTVSARRLQAASADRAVARRPYVRAAQAGRAGRARAPLVHADRQHGRQAPRRTLTVVVVISRRGDHVYKPMMIL